MKSDLGGNRGHGCLGREVSTVSIRIVCRRIGSPCLLKLGSARRGYGRSEAFNKIITFWLITN